MKDVIFRGATGQATVMRACLEGRVPYRIVARFANRPVPTPIAGARVHLDKEGFPRWNDDRRKRGSVSFLITRGGDFGRGCSINTAAIVDHECEEVVVGNPARLLRRKNERK